MITLVSLSLWPACGPGRRVYDSPSPRVGLARRAECRLSPLWLWHTAEHLVALLSQFPGEDGRVVRPRVDAELEHQIAAAVRG